MGTRFWSGYFFPVNIVGHALMIALLAIQIDLKHAGLVIVAVKAVYFLLIAYAILVLRSVLRSHSSPGSGHMTWVYRSAGILSVAVLLVLYGKQAYQFGRLEREVVRDVAIINRGLPITIEPGIAFEKVTLEGRRIIYDYKLPEVESAQFDRPRFSKVVRPLLLKQACRDKWLRRVLDSRIGVHYVYRDRHEMLVDDEPVDEEACAVRGEM